jgi:hypothetical protein
VLVPAAAFGERVGAFMAHGIYWLILNGLTSFLPGGVAGKLHRLNTQESQRRAIPMDAGSLALVWDYRFGRAGSKSLVLAARHAGCCRRSFSL